MKVLLIGSGGREHALAWKISQSPLCDQLYAAPGNPGIARVATCLDAGINDIPRLVDIAKKHAIDLTVVGPEQPLAEGVVNLFEQHGLAIFGPTKEAARLEWSKAFAKEFMVRHRIPTAAYHTFGRGEKDALMNHLDIVNVPVVLKADGLAAGKGVAVCMTRDEAREFAQSLFADGLFGKAGDNIVVEEFLEGAEASVFAVCDGERSVVLAPAQDHKRALDGDLGKNTGGMGAYAPAPVVTESILNEVIEHILVPTLNGMCEDGTPYKGCLYMGLMLTPSGPKVIEYNCRFGDPEAQVILPVFEGDLLSLLYDAARGRLPGPDNVSVSTSNGCAVCVVLASGGYPDAYQTRKEIRGLERVSAMDGILVFHAGTSIHDGRCVTAGGRVLGVTATGESASLPAVIARAYRAVNQISFDHMHFRRDIAAKGVTA